MAWPRGYDVTKTEFMDFHSKGGRDPFQRSKCLMHVVYSHCFSYGAVTVRSPYSKSRLARWVSVLLLENSLVYQ